MRESKGKRRVLVLFQWTSKHAKQGQMFKWGAPNEHQVHATFVYPTNMLGYEHIELYNFGYMGVALTA